MTSTKLVGVLLALAVGGAVTGAVHADSPRAKATAKKKNDATFLREMVQILNETESLDTFVVTVQLLAQSKLAGREVVPVIVRNAERLGILKNFTAVSQGNSRKAKSADMRAKAKVAEEFFELLERFLTAQEDAENGILGGAPIGSGAGALVGAALHNPGAGAAIGGALGAGTRAAAGTAGGETDMTPRSGGRQLTMDEVIALTQQHVSDEQIIQEIRATGSNFSLTPEDILRLKRNGVSDAVVGEMQVRHFTPATAMPTTRG